MASAIVDLVANHDESAPTRPGKNLAGPAPGQGLRLARIGPVLTLVLTGTVLLSAGLFISALWLLGFPVLAPVGPQGISLSRLLDVLKLSFAIVAGVGGVIALVVAYRKQKVTEAAEHRMQAAEKRADEAHQREATKLFNDRFSTASDKLGHDSPAVRLAGVHALAGLADDAPTRELRQTVIDVLCAYLRMPYKPAPGDDGDADERLLFAGLREVRHTIIRIITAHLRAGAATPWQGHNFDFTAVVFDGGDFRDAEFSGGRVTFDDAEFSGGTVSFDRAVFSGGVVTFFYAVFSGGVVTFNDAEFSGGRVIFDRTVFYGSDVTFDNTMFTGGTVTFDFAAFSGGTVTFHSAEFPAGKITFDNTMFTGGTVTFDFAAFSGGTVTFHSAEFPAGKITFDDTEFSAGKVSFDKAKFSGGMVAFHGAEFPGGAVTFRSARFSDGTVIFHGTVFSGGAVTFRSARFSDGAVDFREAADWSYPPTLPDPLPAGVLVPDQVKDAVPEAGSASEDDAEGTGVR
ncbi:pentapeptide repeat domain-containing protein [Planomonospora sphaerica]|uniref:Pentapeptide repeat domain-containing protein n=1 Tax=Planomonospora sphaerica TaxID=161355 RepID=A0A171DJ69_9ACTN|nr:hypothetical protein [Planomonospora sphaerica]GAT68891.1 pentapeptide repeat domain-containing protein [Planomonospora sphaerica]